jgi:hypothetical protein
MSQEAIEKLQAAVMAKKRATSAQVMRNAPDADLAELCAVLTSASQPESDKVPPGWHSKNEIMQAIGKGKTQTQYRLKQAVDSGKMEMRIFRVPNAVGAAVPVPHYRVKK